MSFNLNDLSNRLTRKDETLGLANVIFMDTLFPAAPFSEEDISKEILTSLVFSYVKDNVDVIFRYTTSSIEKIFLGAVLLQAIRKGVLFLQIKEPIRTTIEKVEVFRRNYYSTLELWNIYKIQTGRRSMNEFLQFLDEGPQAYGLNLSEKDKNQFANSMLMHIYYRLKTYFLCLKCNFSDILASGRYEEVDIFVWSMNNPKFKMVIECDEANHYGDKVSFSNDRTRDRFLQSRGFQVLRFSGGEIINDPLGKAGELISFLEAYR